MAPFIEARLLVAIMFPSPCSGLVPVASRGVDEPSVWNVNVCGRLHADAMTTDRNIIYGNGLGIVLCEVCNTPSLVCFASVSCYLRRPEGDAKQLMDRGPVVSLKTPRRLCPRSMTCERSPSSWLNAEPVPTA